MEPVLNNSWYDEIEAAALLGLPLATVHTFFERMLTDPRTPVAHYRGAGIPMLSGNIISALKGRAQAPSARHRR